MVATLVAAGVMAATVRPGRAPVAVAMIVATLWGVAPLVAALLCRRPDAPTDAAVAAPGNGTVASVTTVVRVGDEPDDLVAGAVSIARTLGPVAVVGRRPGTELGAGVADRCDVPVGTALRTIAEGATTSAVLLVSGRVAVRPEAALRAASHLDHGAAWVSGVTRSFNDDRFASERRDHIGAMLRRRAHRSGLWLWEPDATLVATTSLRDDPPEPGRPYGRWLRRQAGHGATGVVTDDEPALRAAPVSSRDHWPDAVARQCAAAADLSDALFGRGKGSGGPRGRLVAAALLLRELSAWPLLLWLATPVLLAAGAPFRIDPMAGAVVLLGLSAARWAALRHLLGVPLAAREDLLAAVNAIPGSLWALTSALRRRIRPSHMPLPARPLVWVCLLATVVAGLGLVRVEPGTPGSRTVALLCIGLLVGLWVLTVRALVERAWERTSFRLPVTLDATLDGGRGRIVDVGPAGAALEIPGSRGPARGEDVAIELVDTSTSGPLELHGVVASCRRRRSSTIVGVELDLDDVARQRWIQRLTIAAAATPDALPAPPPEPGTEVAPPPRRRAATLVDRATFGVVTALSLLVVAALVLVLLGFRPLVIRSGSMEPTHSAGDLVVTDRVLAEGIGVDDVVTLDHYAPIGESMTHRVRAVARDGDILTVTTQGDANDSSETWSVQADQVVGRVVAALPAVGRPAVLVRTSWTAALIASLLVGALAAAVLWGRRRPHTERSTPMPP